MINYYEILGLKTGAGISEIKTAFRRLAKRYHPDVNPTGKEHFTKILKAYEILSNPDLKRSYDYRLKNNLTQQEQTPSKNTAAKNWKFDEKELKRRQYYNEHIKKYAKQQVEFKSIPETKSGYNEFKYILFATPLAVALFLLVMKLAIPGKILARTHVENTTVKEKAVQKKSDLVMGDSPYTHFFGRAQFDSLHARALAIKNLTGADVIVCLFSKEKFIRSRFIENGYVAEIEQLPDVPLRLNYCSGLYFNFAQELKEAKLFGSFTTDLHFFKGRSMKHVKPKNELILQSGLNEGFEQISEKEFFKKHYD